MLLEATTAAALSLVEVLICVVRTSGRGSREVKGGYNGYRCQDGNSTLSPLNVNISVNNLLAGSYKLLTVRILSGPVAAET